MLWKEGVWFMQLWEYLLAEDRRLDLANLKNAGIWLLERPWWPKGSDRKGDPALWNEPAKCNWKQNILCLRTLAQRLKSKRRPASAEEQVQEIMAQKTLFDYLEKLRVTAMPIGNSFRAAVLPTQANGNLAGPPPEPYFPMDGLHVFWQAVFFSFVDGAGAPVCERCGVDVAGKTKTGRAKKRRLCDRCRYKQWRAAQPPEKMRAKWRQDKKNHLL
jgi:hypothetical protein